MHGLANIGNTCFMNACLQILAHTPELNLDTLTVPSPQLNSSNDKIKSADIKLFREWLKLTKQLKTPCSTSNKPIIPRDYFLAFQANTILKHNNQFMRFQQNDSSEVMAILLDAFHNALAREVCIRVEGTNHGGKDEIALQCCNLFKKLYTTQYSHILKCFCGIVVSEIRPLNCVSSKPNNIVISSTSEPYFQIDLPLPALLFKNQILTLHDCLDLYCSGETIEGYKNDKTNTIENVQRTYRFWSFPSILIVNLKRFNQNGQKNNALVNFPHQLDMRKYSYDYYRHETYNYELYAVCQHIGGVKGGHYTAAINVPVNNGSTWFTFNDAHISPIADINQIINNTAYCLYYRKVE